MDHFLLRNKDFVLKLIIPATNGSPSQIRRVKLPRIANAQGLVSYDELAGLVLTIVLPSPEEDDEQQEEMGEAIGTTTSSSVVSSSSSSSSVLLQGYRVFLEYQDMEDDTITISTTEELMDALEQFQAQRLLRLTTRVVATKKVNTSSTTSRKSSSMLPTLLSSASSSSTTASRATQTIPTPTTMQNVASPLPAAAGAARAARAGAATTVPLRPSRTTTTKRALRHQEQQQPLLVHSLVDSLVGALANAVVSIEESLNQLPSTTTTATAASSSSSTTTGTAAAAAATTVNLTKATPLSADTKSSSNSTSNPSKTSPPTAAVPVVPKAEPMVNTKMPSKEKILTKNTIPPTTNSSPVVVEVEVQPPVSKKEASTTMMASQKIEETTLKNTSTTTGTTVVVESSVPPKLLFVHKRHTCDRCTITPIIGTRYHATNRFNYDICEKCFLNIPEPNTSFYVFETDSTNKNHVVKSPTTPSTTTTPTITMTTSPIKKGLIVPNETKKTMEETSTTTIQNKTKMMMTTTTTTSTTSSHPPSSSLSCFIHGRHTCDSCLKTPIVGKRYHAINLTDYDVCEVCFTNYQGQEIQFESVEDERDQAFQARWKRRWDIHNSSPKRSHQLDKRSGGSPSTDVPKEDCHGAGPRPRCGGDGGSPSPPKSQNGSNNGISKPDVCGTKSDGSSPVPRHPPPPHHPPHDHPGFFGHGGPPPPPRHHHWHNCPPPPPPPHHGPFPPGPSGSFSAPYRPPPSGPWGHHMAPHMAPHFGPHMHASAPTSHMAPHFGLHAHASYPPPSWMRSHDPAVVEAERVAEVPVVVTAAGPSPSSSAGPAVTAKSMMSDDKSPRVDIVVETVQEEEEIVVPPMAPATVAGAIATVRPSAPTEEEVIVNDTEKVQPSAPMEDVIAHDTPEKDNDKFLHSIYSDATKQSNDTPPVETVLFRSQSTPSVSSSLGPAAVEEKKDESPNPDSSLVEESSLVCLTINGPGFLEDVWHLNKDYFEFVDEEYHDECGFIPEDLVKGLVATSAQANKIQSVQIHCIVPQIGLVQGMLHSKAGIDKIQIPPSMRKDLLSTNDVSSDESNKSFACDAVGSGEVAEAMGAALDLVANAIDDMLNEGGDESSEYNSGDDDDNDGASIVASSMDEEEGSEWDIVPNNDGYNNDQDAEIARAAEMIGSALFESDMAQSFSSPSTTPRVTQDQRQRWVIQLSQLGELGFLNESKCVEILERLEAANIGSEMLDEEVSVSQVVHELLLEQQ